MFFYAISTTQRMQLSVYHTFERQAQMNDVYITYMHVMEAFIQVVELPGVRDIVIYPEFTLQVL